jgi:hypothetical protein
MRSIRKTAAKARTVCAGAIAAGLFMGVTVGGVVLAGAVNVCRVHPDHHGLCLSNDRRIATTG